MALSSSIAQLSEKHDLSETFIQSSLQKFGIMTKENTRSCTTASSFYSNFYSM